jgi:1,4-dihydroxy-2-naphthoate octaprenyltransferase
MGTAIAYSTGGFRWPAALAALLGGMLIQIGTNLANDYFDFKKGADTATRVGPQRVTQSGLLAPETVRNGFILSFLAAFIIGIYLVYLGGWPIVWIGLVSLLLGVIYTGGPFPLAYHGLAELPAFLFFGPLACATTTYVQTGRWSTAAVLAGSAAGFFSMALLAINNLRDYQEDRKTGKRTLTAVFGRNFGVIEYSLALLLATLAPLTFLLTEPARPWVAMTALTALIAFYPLQRTLKFKQAAELLAVLKMTTKLQAIFTFVFLLTWLTGGQ